MAPTIILITGANRGVGKGLLERYAARDNHIVIAANRDPEHPTSGALENVPTGQGSRIIIVKIDASVESDASAAVQELVSTHGIDHLDLVIANAAISYVYPKVSDLRISDLQAHFKVNVFGVVWLYQATLPLLRKSANPRWITVGSTGGSIKNQPPVPNAAYAPTKTAVHWLTKRMNEEEDWLLAFVVHPGWVQTDMGNYSAGILGGAYGVEEAPVTIDDSCNGVVRLIDSATKPSYGGKMWDYEGTQQAW
ncbi:NAD(P)-binding protein [Hypoxylon crocopeplum]|nr:NAD(P)-binding protein [Hypoxylon crocopeplum]